MVGDLTQREHWGRAFSLYTFTASLGTVVGPLLGGWLYDQAGQTAPFYANASLLVMSALWALLFLRKLPSRPSNIFRTIKHSVTLIAAATSASYALAHLSSIAQQIKQLRATDIVPRDPKWPIT